MKRLRSFFRRSSPQAREGAKDASFPWVALEGTESLSQLLDADDPVYKVVFKHSARCGLSGMMRRRFEQHWDTFRDQADFYLLDLWRNRELSALVADAFAIGHESPQVLIINQGRVIAHASHGGIDGLRPEAFRERMA